MSDGADVAVDDVRLDAVGYDVGAERFQCNGQLVAMAGVSLRLIKAHQDWGKWLVGPATVLTGASNNYWKATGESDTARGVRGHLVYVTDDGDDTCIVCEFYVPFIGRNDAYIYASGKSKDKYDCSCTPVPKDGSSISPVYTVKKRIKQGALHGADPEVRAGNRICEGRQVVAAGVSLNLISQDLRHGKWEVNPASTITGPYDGQFFARGRDGEALGVEGSLRYQASDDAIFTLHFSVPYAKDNEVNITCEGRDCALYLHSVSPVPGPGHKISPTYTITRK
jgi:hypothetical protein